MPRATHRPIPQGEARGPYVQGMRRAMSAIEQAVEALAAASPHGQVLLHTAETGWVAAADGVPGLGAEGDTPIAALMAATKKLGGKRNG